MNKSRESDSIILEFEPFFSTHRCPITGNISRFIKVLKKYRGFTCLSVYSCVAKIYRGLLLQYLYITSAACLPSTVL